MQKRFMSLVAALGLSWGLIPLHAHAICRTITAPTLTLERVDCTQAQVWTTLQASGQFPDVFFPPGKTLPICYASSEPASAWIGQHRVTITSDVSGFTTDFVPGVFGGEDNLGTIVRQLTIVDPSGNYTGKLFVRVTVDASQVATGTATEEDVIVGGTNNFGGAKGTYRADAAPNQDASIVTLTHLDGIVCSNNW